MTDPIIQSGQSAKQPALDYSTNQQFKNKAGTNSLYTQVEYARSESTIVNILSLDTTRPISPTNTIKSLSPEQAANNVLQFIAQRLANLKAGGADDAVLENALQQAREGFATGFTDAKNILESGNQLNPEQAQRLERVESRFSAGIEAIEKALFGETDFSDEVANETRAQVNNALNSSSLPIQPDNDVLANTPPASTADSTPASAPSIETSAPASGKYIRAELNEVQKFKSVEKRSIKARENNEAREFPAQFINSYQSARASFKRQESVELQLRTQDGDIVTLSFSAKQSAKFKFDAAGSVNYDPQALGSALFESGSSRAFSKLFGSSALNISVQGNIDDGELAALEELFGQLSEVFSAFFNGDGETALEQALQLDFNAEEIAQFSVDLQLSEKQKVVQRYREIADFGDATQRNTNGKGLNVGDYLQQIRDIAVNKVKTVEKTLVEQLLSISFAAGNLNQLDDGDIEEGDDDERSAPAVIVDAPAATRLEDAAEFLA